MRNYACFILIALVSSCASPLAAQILNETYRFPRPDFLPYNEFDTFGTRCDVSADGRTVLAGANSYGAVVFFRSEFDVWETYALIPSQPLELHDPWRIAISDDGKTAVLGARDAFSPTDKRQRTGVAFVFRLGENGWYEEAVLLGSDSVADDRFGAEIEVSSDGAFVLVGAPEHSDDPKLSEGNGTFPGSAYLFRRDDDGAWSEVAELSAEPGGFFFGRELAISENGDDLVIADLLLPSQERVSIFVRSEEGVYESDTTFSISASTLSISRDAGVLLVGSHVFRRDTNGAWIEEASLGRSAELFADRDAAVAGVFEPNDDRAAYVYERRDGSWEEAATLVVSNEQSNFHYYSVNAGKDWVVLGVSNISTIYLFDLSSILVGVGPLLSIDNPHNVGTVRPNPFVSEAHVSVSVDRPEHVTAVLFDVLGREVGRPLDTILLSGQTVFSLDGDKLTPGVYLLHVSGDGWRQTRKLTRAAR